MYVSLSLPVRVSLWIKERDPIHLRLSCIPRALWYMDSHDIVLLQSDSISKSPLIQDSKREPTEASCLKLREWSLITGRGGYKTGGGGAREVLPLRKGGGGGKSFSHSEGGGAQQVLG